MPNVVTIREAIQRAKSDGMPVSEYTLRQWVKTGEIPTRRAGTKTLIYYPNLVSYLQGGDDVRPIVAAPGIRRIGV